jgi:hypothetical protein
MKLAMHGQDSGSYECKKQKQMKTKSAQLSFRCFRSATAARRYPVLVSPVQWLHFCETPTKKTILLSSVLEICYHTCSLAEPSLRTEPCFLVTGTLLMWWRGPCPLVTLLGRSETDYVQWKHSCSGRALP